MVKQRFSSADGAPPLPAACCSLPFAWQVCKVYQQSSIARHRKH